MRKLAFLIVMFASVAACGSEVAATGVTGQPDDRNDVASAQTGQTDQPTATPVATPNTTVETPQAQATPTATNDEPNDGGVSEQRVRDIEFRLSQLERLLSAGDGMFSLEDDLANADGRLRAQQRCINALVLTARSHQHSSDTGNGITGPGQFGAFDSPGLDATSYAMMLSVECGSAVDETLVAKLADDYGIDVK